MPPFGQIARSYLKSLPVYFSSQSAWILVAVGVLIAWQYLRVQRMEVALFGRARYPLPQRMLFSVVFGLVGGLVGSLLLTGLGVAISAQWIGKVMICSLLLALLDMRLICFAYSAGLLSLSRLLLGWPEIDVASLLALVAVLHLVESVMMLLSGHLAASPLYVRREDGQLVGGYSLQLFWPLPLLALMVMPQLLPGGGTSLAMPAWWPLIKPIGAPLSGDFTLYMVPLLAALGYGDLAVTASPRRKVRQSAGRLLLFSLTLLGLAWLGSRQAGWLWLAAIFSPLGHELLIVIGNRQEQAGRPLWQHTGPGVMIMEVQPGGWAERAGLRPRDLLLTIDDVPLGGSLAWREQLELAVQAKPSDQAGAPSRGEAVDQAGSLGQGERRGAGLQLTVARAGGRTFGVSLSRQQAADPGLLLVPDGEVENFVETRFRSPLLWFWRRRGR